MLVVELAVVLVVGFAAELVVGFAAEPAALVIEFVVGVVKLVVGLIVGLVVASARFFGSWRLCVELYNITP